VAVEKQWFLVAKSRGLNGWRDNTYTESLYCLKQPKQAEIEQNGLKVTKKPSFPSSAINVGLTKIKRIGLTL
jgi:hypothetical protein